MTDNEIKKALECYRGQVLFTFNGKKPEIYIHDIIDLINRLEADKEALIAGQETLQKALVEKNAEIDRLKAERNQYIEDQPYVWANVARELDLYDRPCVNCRKNKLTGPPQSWCYVERLGEV